LDAQKQQNIFVMLIIASLVIALKVPIDSLVWDSTFVFWIGYGSLFVIVETGILLATMLTFFISVYTRGYRTYTFLGIGALLAFAGRNILINSDSWLTPIPGLACLAVGTWLICAGLRRVYLWL
jgi:hypothetical protein